MGNAVTMSFDNGINRVRIQKATLNALGNPRHIVMLYSKDKHKFILQPIIVDEARRNGISMWSVISIPDEVYANGRHFEYQNNVDAHQYKLETLCAISREGDCFKPPFQGVIAHILHSLSGFVTWQ